MILGKSLKFHKPYNAKGRFYHFNIFNILIFEATARSECTAKQENKVSYNTCYIAPDLIDFFGDY